MNLEILLIRDLDVANFNLESNLSSGSDFLRWLASNVCSLASLHRDWSQLSPQSFLCLAYFKTLLPFYPKRIEFLVPSFLLQSGSIEGEGKANKWCYLRFDAGIRTGA